MNRLIHVGPLVLALLACACGSPKTTDHNQPDPQGSQPPPQTDQVPATLRVHFSFAGPEPPERVEIVLAQDQTPCPQLERQEPGQQASHRTELSAQGTTVFQSVDPGTYMVWLRGWTQGMPVAFGCQQAIQVMAGEVTESAVAMENLPLLVDGPQLVKMTVNLHLPPAVQDTLGLLDLACDAAGLGQVCNITGQVVELVESMDVDAQWHVNQSGAHASGALAWTAIEGADVTDLAVVNGEIHGTIPGATSMVLTPTLLEIHVDRLVRFVIEEMLDIDLGALGPLVSLVLDQLSEILISDIKITGGWADLRDYEGDGITDSMFGTMEATVSFPVVGYEHDLDLDWSATKLQ
jgi:hypothetical protein